MPERFAKVQVVALIDDETRVIVILELFRLRTSVRQHTVLTADIDRLPELFGDCRGKRLVELGQTAGAFELDCSRCGPGDQDMRREPGEPKIGLDVASREFRIEREFRERETNLAVASFWFEQQRRDIQPRLIDQVDSATILFCCHDSSPISSAPGRLARRTHEDAGIHPGVTIIVYVLPATRVKCLCRPGFWLDRAFVIEVEPHYIHNRVIWDSGVMPTQSLPKGIWR